MALSPFSAVIPSSEPILVRELEIETEKSPDKDPMMVRVVLVVQLDASMTSLCCWYVYEFMEISSFIYFQLISVAGEPVVMMLKL